MNRDEQRARVAALAPCRVDLGGRVVLHPSEPTGGTWIAANDLGVACALVNGYAIPAKAVDRRISRGEVVLATRHCADASAISEQLAALELSRIPPFRLIGVVPKTRTVQEWRWNQRELTSWTFGWEPCGWWSSGHDEPGAQRVRGAIFEKSREQADAGTTCGLRRLHGSHLPEEGPYSICMHRKDAATVSYTEVEVGRTFCRMRYEPGPPCQLGTGICESGEVSVADPFGGADFGGKSVRKRVPLHAVEIRLAPEGAVCHEEGVRTSARDFRSVVRAWRNWQTR